MSVTIRSISVQKSGTPIRKSNMCRIKTIIDDTDYIDYAHSNLLKEGT
jgi:hypothetical protein